MDELDISLDATTALLVNYSAVLDMDFCDMKMGVVVAMVEPAVKPTNIFN